MNPTTLHRGSVILPRSFPPGAAVVPTGRLALSGVAPLAFRSASPFPSPPRHRSESSIDFLIISRKSIGSPEHCTIIALEAAHSNFVLFNGYSVYFGCFSYFVSAVWAYEFSYTFENVLSPEGMVIGNGLELLFLGLGFHSYLITKREPRQDIFRGSACHMT